MPTPTPLLRPSSESGSGWLPIVLLALLALGIALWQATPLVPWRSAEAARVALVLLVFAPVAEELIFRAGLQEALLRRGCRPLASSVLTACVFGGLHLLLRSTALGVAVLPVSLLLSAVYLRWRRVTPCILLHAALNLGWLLLGR